LHGSATWQTCMQIIANAHNIVCMQRTFDSQLIPELAVLQDCYTTVLDFFDLNLLYGFVNGVGRLTIYGLVLSRRHDV